MSMKQTFISYLYGLQNGNKMKMSQFSSTTESPSRHCTSNKPKLKRRTFHSTILILIFVSVSFCLLLGTPHRLGDEGIRCLGDLVHLASLISPSGHQILSTIITGIDITNIQIILSIYCLITFIRTSRDCLRFRDRVIIDTHLYCFYLWRGLK